MDLAAGFLAMAVRMEPEAGVRALADALGNGPSATAFRQLEPVIAAMHESGSGTFRQFALRLLLERSGHAGMAGMT